LPLLLKEFLMLSMRTGVRRLVAVGLLGVLMAGPMAESASTDSTTFTVLQRWKLGGAGTWDYLTLDCHFV
jgi:hypothetical protein